MRHAQGRKKGPGPTWVEANAKGRQAEIVTTKVFIHFGPKGNEGHDDRSEGRCLSDLELGSRGCQFLL